MAKQRYDEELLLRVRTLEGQRRYKSAEFWKHTDGWPYKLSRIIFFIMLLPFFFWQLIYYFANPYSKVTTAQMGDWRRNMAIIALTTAAMLAAFILVILKKHLPALILSVGVAVVTGLFFNQALQAGAANSSEVTEVGSHVGKLVIRHILPMAVLCVACLILFLVRYFDVKAERLAYEHAANRIYEQFRRMQEESGTPAEMMSQEQWSELVRQYDGEIQYGRLKRSKKDALRKQGGALSEKKPEPESE